MGSGVGDVALTAGVNTGEDAGMGDDIVIGVDDPDVGVDVDMLLIGVVLTAANADAAAAAPLVLVYTVGVDDVLAMDGLDAESLLGGEASGDGVEDGSVGDDRGATDDVVGTATPMGRGGTRGGATPLSTDDAVVAAAVDVVSGVPTRADVDDAARVLIALERVASLGEDSGDMDGGEEEGDEMGRAEGGSMDGGEPVGRTAEGTYDNEIET